MMETAWRKFALLQWKTNFLMATPWIIARYKAFGATFKMTLTSPQQTPMHSTINYKNVWGKKIKLSKSNFLLFEKYFSQIYFPIFFEATIKIRLVSETITIRRVWHPTVARYFLRWRLEGIDKKIKQTIIRKTTFWPVDSLWLS